jgi:protein phosphatase 1 regulatory subunit 7
VAALPNLVSLNMEKNNVKDFKALNVEEGWKTLRVLNLNLNKVAELVPINVPNLMELSLVENKIEKIETFGGHPKLKKLELRRNKIANLQGLSNLPELNELYLAENKIKSLAGLDIPNIKILHLRKNVVLRV